MPRTHANGIELEYRIEGPEDGRPLVLIRGLGTQMIQWHPDFRERLVASGHRLVTFDNRDTGLSTHLHDEGAPKLGEVFEALAAGVPAPVPYTLDHMADDVAALLDAAELASAHVAGISMGGMIGQQLAARHPARVRSLVSIMSSTGNPTLPPPTKEAMEALMSPAPPERDAYIEHHVRTSQAIGSPGYPTPDAERREIAGRVFDRAFDPQGVARQFAAIQASADRRADLARISTPTLVIHGLDDPLVHVEGGRDTAKTIPGARLQEVPGMGHDVPAGLFELLADAIAGHTREADTA